MMREDRRQRLLQLSERGSEMMRTRKQIRIQQAAVALALITEDQRMELLQLLQALLLSAGPSLLPELQSESIRPGFVRSSNSRQSNSKHHRVNHNREGEMRQN